MKNIFQKKTTMRDAAYKLNNCGSKFVMSV